MDPVAGEEVVSYAQSGLEEGETGCLHLLRRRGTNPSAGMQPQPGQIREGALEDEKVLVRCVRQKRRHLFETN